MLMKTMQKANIPMNMRKLGFIPKNTMLTTVVSKRLDPPRFTVKVALLKGFEWLGSHTLWTNKPFVSFLLLSLFVSAFKLYYSSAFVL